MTEDKRRTGDAIEIPGDYQYRAITEGFSVQRYWHASKLKIIDRAVNIGPQSIALDCGCGSGVVADHLAEKAKEVVGVDGSPRAIEFARGKFQRPNLKFVQSLVEDVPYPDGYFSNIFCMEVVEHLYEPQTQTLLAKFQELLKPGGQVFLTTPNYHGVWPLVEKLADKSGKVAHMDESQHVSHYHRSNLVRQVNDAGFAVERVGTFCTIAPFAAAVSRGMADIFFNLEWKVNLPFGNLLYLLARKE